MEREEREVAEDGMAGPGYLQAFHLSLVSFLCLNRVTLAGSKLNTEITEPRRQ